jgi:hypothetical protein
MRKGYTKIRSLASTEENNRERKRSKGVGDIFDGWDIN